MLLCTGEKRKERVSLRNGENEGEMYLCGEAYEHR